MATMKNPDGRMKFPSQPLDASASNSPFSVLLVLADAPSSIRAARFDVPEPELRWILRSRRVSRRACCTLGRVFSSRSRIRTCGSIVGVSGVMVESRRKASRRLEGADPDLNDAGCELEVGLRGVDVFVPSTSEGGLLALRTRRVGGATDGGMSIGRPAPTVARRFRIAGASTTSLIVADRATSLVGLTGPAREVEKSTLAVVGVLRGPPSVVRLLAATALIVCRLMDLRRRSGEGERVVRGRKG